MTPTNTYIELPNGSAATVTLFVEAVTPEKVKYDSHEVIAVTLPDGTVVRDFEGVDLHTAGYEFLIQQGARRAVVEVDAYECWRQYLAAQREYDEELWG